MRYRREASVLPFRATCSVPGVRAAGTGSGVVLRLRARKKTATDTEGPDNAAWDELTRLVLEAWCWRDPESLARLDACVGRLRREVEREWS